MISRLRTLAPFMALVGLMVTTFGGLQALRPSDSAEIVATRVVASPVPPPTPEPTPRPHTGPPECTPLNNPGGGLHWAPSADAGPWPTDGTVQMPSLGVTAPIVRVGVGTSGEMVIPRTARDVAWLDQGSFPGRTQNAVLAGHINWSRQPGSFARIGQLREGDPVVVAMDGRRFEFRVTWVCSFDRNSPRAEQIMGYTDVPSVTLITCGGTFDRRAGTHTNRIVARAELVSVTEV